MCDYTCLAWDVDPKKEEFVECPHCHHLICWKCCAQKRYVKYIGKCIECLVNDANYMEVLQRGLRY